jgi:hypothetical protein
MKKITLFLVFITLGFSVLAQGVKAALTVTNQSISGSEFSFDIYLNTVTGTTGDLFLGNADFVFTFDVTKFTSPMITQVGAASDFCTFVPITATGTNIIFTQDGYFNRTSPSLSGSEIRVNLSDPAPGSQTVFNTRIAKIDGSPLTHCLGRFKITGFTGTTLSNVNLQWKLSGAGVVTDVYSLENIAVNPVSPFNAFPSYVVMLSQASVLPLELISFVAKTQNNKHTQLSWTTAQERNVEGFDLQISKNGTTWETIGFVAAKNVNDAKYDYTDFNVHQGNQSESFYYRLKIKDLDGSFEFSSINKIVFTGQLTSVQLYPNPAENVLNLQCSEAINEDVILHLYDLTGKLILNHKFYIATNYALSLPQSLAKGEYVLKILGQNNLEITSELISIL